MMSRLEVSVYDVLNIFFRRVRFSHNRYVIDDGLCNSLSLMVQPNVFCFE